MWIFCTSGFYSVVTDTKHEGFMPVRARCRQDIFNLYNEHSDWLKSMSKPTSDESRDYRWRLGLSHKDWTRLACRLAQQVTYPNFKSTCAKRPDQIAKLSALHEIWQTMMRLQLDERPEPKVRKATAR